MTGPGHFALKALVASMLLAFDAMVYALPAGGAVVAGAASISSNALSTTINQSTQNAAINWQSFNIAAGESVRVLQPNSSSVLLNRVLGSDPSNILGSLSANGKVFLVNPNGILFGRGASVNTAGLVASTLNVSDSDFMAGSYKFAGNSTAAVLNQGSINADGGYVALLGASVTNNGVIQARLGSVALAAGNAMTLDVAGDGLLNVSVSQGALSALAQNGGLIQADGGQVLLSAQSAGALFQSAVNNTGVIQAQTLQNHNGAIRLMGDMQSGTVHVGGTLDASAPNGGNGGFVETSAAQVKVADNVAITTQSAQGTSGRWLIDPVDFTVAAGSDIAGATLGGQLVTTSVTILSSNGTHGGVNGDVNVNEPVTWTASGAPTTLTLNAFNDVNVNAAITATTGNLVSIAGRDVNLNAAITTTTGSTRSTAVRDINVTAAMTTTTGSVLLRAGSDGSGSGVAGLGGTVVFAPGILYTVTAAAPDTVRVDYTPTSYATPHDYSGNFTGTGATLLTQHMLVFAKGNDKIYDGNTSAALSFKGDPTLGGVVTLVPGTATFDTRNAGTGKTITYAGYSLGGTDAAGFALFAPLGNPAGSGAATADITPRALTVTATGSNKVYDGNTADAVALADNRVAGDTLILSNTAANFADKNVGNAKAVGVTGISVTGTDAVNYSFNTTAATTASITPAPLGIAAQSTSKTYGTTLGFNGTEFSSTGLKNGETIGSVSLTSAGALATASVAGSLYEITPSAASGGSFSPGNYTINYVHGELGVIPAPLAIVANSTSKTYGSTVSLTGTEFSSTGLKNGETIASVSLASAGAPAAAGVAGSPYDIKASAASGGSFNTGNYSISYVDGALGVIPAPLGIVANSTSKTFGSTITFNGTEFSSTGLKNGETIASVSLTSAGAVATAGVAGSPYDITPGAASGGTFSAGNYTISYVDGALGVIPAGLLGIAANSAAKIYDGLPYSGGNGVMYTGFQAGDTPASLSGTLTYGGSSQGAIPVGSYAIVPSGQSSPNYTIAYVNGKLSVTPAPLGIAANNAARVYGDANPAFSATYTGFQNGETAAALTGALALSTPAVATSGVGNYAIVPSGQSSTNYTVTYVNGKLGVTPAPLGIVANDGSKTYGSTVSFSGTEFSSTGLKNGETIGRVSLASAGALATASVAGSPYEIAPSAATGGSFNAGNYAISYVHGELGVTPAPLTVTANNTSKAYGQAIALPGTAFTAAGLLNGDTVGSVSETSPGTVATASVAGSPYAITPGGATGGSFDATNYTISYVNGALTVSPIPLTITASDATKIYGQTPDLSGFATTPLVNGESVTSVTEASAGQSATAPVAGSPYAIVPSAASGSFAPGNYTITYFNGVLTSLFAQTTTADTAQRDVNQQTRIENGLKSGSLTVKETGRLEREQSQIDRLQAKDLKEGKLTPAERAQLRRLQDRASRDIKAAETNAAKGDPNSKSSQRLQAPRANMT